MPDTRQKMIKFRKDLQLDIEVMAKLSQCSPGLLREVEGGWITHPKIAARIVAAYELDVDDYNELVHMDYKAEKLPKPTPKPKGYMGDWRNQQ